MKLDDINSLMSLTRANVAQAFVVEQQEIHQQAWQNLPQDEETGSEDLRTEVKNLRRTIQRQLSRSYWIYLNTVCTGEDTPDQAGKNRRFWSYIKYQKSSNTGVVPPGKGWLPNIWPQCIGGTVKRTVSASLRRWKTVHSRRVWAEYWNGWQRHTHNWWY